MFVAVRVQVGRDWGRIQFGGSPPKRCYTMSPPDIILSVMTRLQRLAIRRVVVILLLMLSLLLLWLLRVLKCSEWKGDLVRFEYSANGISKILTICSELTSFWLGFCWLLEIGGVTDEHEFMFGGVVVVGELPVQPTPLTECWYIMVSPAE